MKVDVMLPKEQRNQEEGDMERDRKYGGTGETYSIYNMEFMKILENDKNNYHFRSVLEVWKPTESLPSCETVPSHASWVVFSTRDNPRAQEYKFGNFLKWILTFYKH